MNTTQNNDKNLESDEEKGKTISPEASEFDKRVKELKGEQALIEQETKVKDEFFKSQKEKDRAPKDQEIDGFFEWIGRLKEGGKPLSPDQLAEDFFFWFESAESAEEQARGREELKAKYNEWLSANKEKDEGFWGTLKKIYEKFNRLDKGIESYSWERAYGTILDKRVAEILSANLNARDRMGAFNRACRLKHKFEAQAVLLSMGHTSDLTEKWVDDFYKAFGKKIAVPVYDSQSKPKLDADGKVVMKVGWHGTERDVWFEQKLRRETKGKGHRPDIWHGGQREYIKNEEGEIIGVCFKSREWQAAETDFDALLTPGRKGDTASETHDYQMISSKEAAQAMYIMLERRRDKIPQEITEIQDSLDSVEAKLENAQKVFEDQSGKLSPDEQTIMRNKINHYRKDVQTHKKKISDEYLRMNLIGERLKKGINVGDPKSLLLDPTDSEEENVVTIVGEDGEKKTFYEADLSVALGTRKYWQARTDQDAGVIVRGEHVTATERELFITLMGNNYRDEFFWSCQHWWLGTRKNGVYDRQRDGAKNIWDYINSKDNAKASRLFAETTRGYTIEHNEKEGNKVVALDDDGKEHLLDRSVVDADDTEALMKFNVDAPHIRDAIKSTPVFSKMKEAEVDVQEVTPALNPLTQALLKGLPTARSYIKRNPVSDLPLELGKSKDQLTAYKSDIAEFLTPIVWQEDQQDKVMEDVDFQRVKTAIAEKISKLSTGQKIEVQFIEDLSHTLGLTDAQVEGLKKSLDDLNSKIENISRAFSAMEAMQTESELILAVLTKRREGENDEYFAKRLKDHMSEMKKEEDRIPAEDKIDITKKADKSVMDELKEKAFFPERLTGDELYLLLQEFDLQERVLGQAVEYLVEPQTDTQKPEKSEKPEKREEKRDDREKEKGEENNQDRPRERRPRRGRRE